MCHFSLKENRYNQKGIMNFFLWRYFQLLTFIKLAEPIFWKCRWILDVFQKSPFHTTRTTALDPNACKYDTVIEFTLTTFNIASDFIIVKLCCVSQLIKPYKQEMLFSIVLRFGNTWFLLCLERLDVDWLNSCGFVVKFWLGGGGPKKSSQICIDLKYHLTQV